VGRAPKKPQLTKQNSSDLANEEWETASESSDVLDRRDKDSKNDSANGGIKDPQGGKDRRESKKSFSSQRPGGDRQNRKGGGGGNNPGEGRGGKSGSVERTNRNNKECSPNSTKANGVASGGGRPNQSSNKNNKNVSNMSRKENVNPCFRVDGVVPEDPTAIQNAINSLNNK
jgi:hypothetical protein